MELKHHYTGVFAFVGGYSGSTPYEKQYMVLGLLPRHATTKRTIARPSTATS